MSEKRQLRVCLTPALFHLYADRKSIVVVVDVLRATSAMCTAFHYGISELIPVSSVEQAKQYINKEGYIRVIIYIYPFQIVKLNQYMKSIHLASLFSCPILFVLYTIELFHLWPFVNKQKKNPFAGYNDYNTTVYPGLIGVTRGKEKLHIVNDRYSTRRIDKQARVAGEKSVKGGFRGRSDRDAMGLGIQNLNNYKRFKEVADEVITLDLNQLPSARQIKQDIYNGTTTGKTADLNNISNLTAPVAWYRMGD